jgi:hypothetical protein
MLAHVAYVKIHQFNLDGKIDGGTNSFSYRIGTAYEKN